MQNKITKNPWMSSGQINDVCVANLEGVYLIFLPNGKDRYVLCVCLLCIFLENYSQEAIALMNASKAICIV